MFRLGLSVASALALASLAGAQLSLTGPFVGQEHEEYDHVLTYPWPQCAPARVFNDNGDACTPAGPYLVIVNGWLLYCALYPHNGSDGLAGSAQGPFEYTFDHPVQRFGGYFGTIGYQPGGWADFYDGNGNWLATMPITAPACAWGWNGWDAGNGPKIERVMVYANDPYNGGGLMQMDDMEIDFAPACGAVTTYCTGKVNSLGCTPSISLSGTASASAGSGAPLRTVNVIGNKSGVFFHSTTGSAGLPFHGGFLCLHSPTKRHALHSSGGTPGTCDGMFQEDLNAYIASGVDPALVAGAGVWIQHWSRDQAAPFGDSLSDAVSVTICP